MVDVNGEAAAAVRLVVGAGRVIGTGGKIGLEVASVVDDVRTVTNPNASTGDRIIAGISLASGIPGGWLKSVLRIGNDAKDAKTAAKTATGADNAGDAAAGARTEAAAGGGRSGEHFRGEDPRAEGTPHTRFRTDDQGRVTHYETYNSPEPGKGKRVDVTGPAHGGVETPHVTDTQRHTNPEDPSKTSYTEGPTRPAEKHEIPTHKR
jgi:hypothetical protein